MVSKLNVVSGPLEWPRSITQPFQVLWAAGVQTPGVQMLGVKVAAVQTPAVQLNGVAVHTPATQVPWAGHWDWFHVPTEQWCALWQLLCEVLPEMLQVPAPVQVLCDV